MIAGRKAFSMHNAGGRMQMSTMRPLAAATSGGYRASSGGNSSFSISDAGLGAGTGFGGGTGLGGSGIGFGGGGGFGASFGSSVPGGELFFGANEKHTMQGLNDRLAIYLKSVRSLEAENNDLELKIREWYSQQIGGDGGHHGRDYSPLENEILELQNKVVAAKQDNASYIIQIDNAKLAADDFRMKYESEKVLRTGVEADLLGLRRVLDEMTLSRSDLEMEIEGLKEELEFMKKSHEEDMRTASSGISGQVNVELDAAPDTNLMDEMDACRKEYEGMVDQIRRDAEKWYNEKAKEVNQAVTSDKEALSSNKSEISDLRRTVQSLEIELQTLLTMKASLERNLAETENQYGVRLQEIQLKIHALEEQLSNLRTQTENQNQDYQMLLDIKVRLEQEIETYRILLDGEDSRHKSSTHGSGSGFSSSTSQGINVKTTSITKAPEPPRPVSPEPDPVRDPVLTTKVKTITQIMVDGVLQSTEVNEKVLPGHVTNDK
ncbi:keratin, type I cytoskeletal 15-like [Protopterus annectens]|uniref:keratin, type I cytoskeletal 15-like n=1 Tax=Protopterus annectens TaxID=7888 RepID=UPI001CFC375D|nr:keratin, type I cytoskeletal 15-like [Protopterus annectens]